MTFARTFQLALLALMLTSSVQAFAVQPDEILSDPAQEARARTISKSLRCLVCQNESIDDSEAPLAHDLRVLVRERLKAGDSDDQVKQYLVSRYGQYVLLKPPFEASTLFLWVSPPLLLFAGIGMAMMLFRNRKTTPAIAPLSLSEHRRVDEILGTRRDGEE